MNSDLAKFKKCGKLVFVKKPEFDELDYVSLLWSDKETMNDVGGPFLFTEEHRAAWYSQMVYPSDGKNFYCLVYAYDNNPVGEVSFHRFNVENKTAEFNIKIQYKYRHRGYGKDAISLMLDYYFNEFGGQIMMDEVANANGEKAVLKFGFEVISRSEGSVVFKMTKERFQLIMETNLK